MTLPATRTRLTAALCALALAAGALAVLTPSPPASAEPGAAVVAEDFSAGTLPAGWRAVDGAWKVENGRLYGTSTSSAASNKITFGRHLNDFRFEATVRFESVASATRWTALGLDVPADGATPWWIATMRSGTTAANGLEFAERTTANTWNVTNTGSAPYAAGTGRDVRVAVEVHGSQARWFVDGREALRTSSLRRSADGGQALLVNGATVSFDDVTVTELAPNGYLRPDGSPLTVIAHRGASAAAPENTLVAQEVARRASADWIENDVQPSRDGVPFVLHDTTVDRTTDGVGRIRDLTAAQLKALDAGSWFAPQYAGEKLPTLAEQLADLRTRGGNLLLEIKGAHTRDEVARIVEVIRAERMTSRVFIQSFEVDALRHTRDLAPELPLGLLRGSLDADPVALARQLGLTAYNPSGAALAARPDVVRQLHDAGVAVLVWTIDSPHQWQSLEQADVDGIITNRPAELAGWNAAYLQRPPATPSVAIASPADGAILDRAQAPDPHRDRDQRRHRHAHPRRAAVRRRPPAGPHHPAGWPAHPAGRRRRTGRPGVGDQHLHRDGHPGRPRVRDPDLRRRTGHAHRPEHPAGQRSVRRAGRPRRPAGRQADPGRAGGGRRRRRAHPRPALTRSVGGGRADRRPAAPRVLSVAAPTVPGPVPGRVVGVSSRRSARAAAAVPCRDRGCPRPSPRRPRR
ncbi:glycerophosphodiester phosphodiesterase family protein [Micromonospora halophytica]|uniref:Glycerophosphoryl diester phosphodiesterase n=1 Tax=Micromonospora halophytica TaxID=47864 RepID=A0A1C5I6K8_9ACTN|nr:glycerophosphodiester phosphodiesterase family protein [Micromonospora halophytica]SCG53795.1 glycerophosphoryl diester phosphodiesterase [Micromonospora halophytica]